MTEQLAPKRFPRLLTGEAVGFLTTLLWQELKFSVAVTKKKKAIVFKLTVPVHDELRRSYPGIWELFFGEGVEDWKKHLSTAYWNTEWGDKQLSRSIAIQFKLVYEKALYAWFESYLRSSQDSDKKTEQLQAFRDRATIKKVFSLPSSNCALNSKENRIEMLQCVLRKYRICFLLR
jgi:hypothetical protein